RERLPTPQDEGCGIHFTDGEMKTQRRERACPRPPACYGDLLALPQHSARHFRFHRESRRDHLLYRVICAGISLPNSSPGSNSALQKLTAQMTPGGTQDATLEGRFLDPGVRLSRVLQRTPLDYTSPLPDPVTYSFAWQDQLLWDQFLAHKFSPLDFFTFFVGFKVEQGCNVSAALVTCSCVMTLGYQLVVLFGKVIEPLGDGTLLDFEDL
ncbi:hypothetical protein STEG23_036325, partial [Scotinomys teguina]